MKLIFCFLTALWCLNTQAALSPQLNLSFGPSLDGTPGTKKAFLLGIEQNWGGPSLEVEGGTWNELNGSFTGYVGANVGVHVVTPDGFSVRVGFGPSFITQTDDRLSYQFEFNLSARLGYEYKGWGAGGCVRHWSDAGIVGPNLGFDLACAYVTIPLGGR
jgi:hypothetical protein